MNEYKPEHSSKEPWWNDGDKVGGAAATIVLLSVLTAAGILLIAGAFKIALWIV